MTSRTMKNNFEKVATKTEGDVNATVQRTKWQEQNLSLQTKRLIEEDEKYFIKQALSTPCLDAVQAVDGIYLIDADGRKIMDFHGNSVHQLGYNHPALLATMMGQIHTLSFSPRRYCNDSATAFAKKLCELMPSDNYKVLFTTSGAASNEIALKLVRKATGKHKVIAMWDSFHGANLATASVGGTSHFRTGMGALMSGCEHAMPYNSYRSLFGDCSGNGELDYIEYICKCEGDIGAIIMEPIRCTDVQIPPKAYYKRLREICDRYDVALIFDEIPTALGRTGKMFAFENYEIEPDILTLGKGLGGSLLPFSAIVANKKFDVCEDVSLGHYTHEKNPVASAVALALVNYIEQNNLLDYVKKLHEIMISKANDMKHKYKIVGDVRCVGALMGIELVKDRTTKEKATEQAEMILYKCLHNGLSFKISQGNVLTLAPPLIIGEKELMDAMDIVDRSIAEITQ